MLCRGRKRACCVCLLLRPATTVSGKSQLKLASLLHLGDCALVDAGAVVSRHVSSGEQPHVWLAPFKAPVFVYC